MSTSVGELRYSACLKTAQLSWQGISGGKYDLTSEDKQLLSLIFCLKDLNRENKMTPAEQQQSLPNLVELIKQVKAFAQKNKAKTAVVASRAQHLIFFAHQGKIVPNMTDNAAFGPVAGPKQKEGDMKTPAGEYKIVSKKSQSKYTLFLGLSYPSCEQAKAAQQAGDITKRQEKVICAAERQNRLPNGQTYLGGDVGIHGPNTELPDTISATALDWTIGCIAIERYMLRKYWNKVRLGTPVLIIH